ncbi:phage repressor protein C with HTH and peptisase S24 domain [Sinorhizobium fredii]
MSSLTETLHQQADKVGITQAEIARRLGVSQQAINHLFSGRVVSTAHWREIARLLNMSEDQMRALMIEAGRDPERNTRLPKILSMYSQVREKPEENATIGEQQPLSIKSATKRLIPVLGEAVGGEDGEYLFNGSVLDYVECPPSLDNVPNAYSVYVDGESMSPRYRPGEVVYVHPGKPPRRGDDVVVQIHRDKDDSGEPPRGYIKEYVGWTSTKLILQQHNPSKKIEFEKQQVVSVHPIILSGKYS